MSLLRTPNANDALFKAFVGQALKDPGDADLVESPDWVDALHFYKPVQDNVLALIKAAVSLPQYEQTFACDASLAVGDPVRMEDDNEVALATSDTAPNAEVFAFCAYKPTTTTCLIVHFYYVSGLSGGTFGDECYLQDDGTFDTTAGSIEKVVGFYISATEALLYADPITANQGSPSSLTVTSTHGGTLKRTFIEEEITLANAASTDSTANLLPAGAVILAVTGRVTLGLANPFSVGDAGDSTRFASAVAGALNTTFNSLDSATPTAPLAWGSTANKIRLTHNAADNGKKVRVTVFYEIVTPPTS